ncbi:hypothetical protein SAMN04487936_107126 [Halobacillus dabanensis]|uniref:Uncharacterized protein n=1 Tax=Halobacillus dabanensis TaxID=240302 RepID=A0A1I3WSU7_HALDA|nr:hypothetical protein [Halobacillus dabanensis]SFK10585.1 hypothetical protein SAMN04487936_107126 [Halobacillus dabanensis]
MKRIFRYTFFALILLIVIIIGFLKINPPLAHGSIGTTEDKHTVIVALGNKSLLGSIHITDVSINNNQSTPNAKIQVSDSEKGFMLTDTYALADDTYGMYDYETFSLDPDTSPMITKAIASTVEKSPTTIYGLSITEDTSIDSINLTYRYFGLVFFTTIKV